MDNNISISWYGRCCFLIESDLKSVLFDPYDTFCNVDIGIIETDILISSSTWHDHGHIGASPKAYICTYPGKDIGSGLNITGIETKEERGTPNVIFNYKVGQFSITNFADFGQDQEFSKENKEALESTNIAFVRSGTNYELALKYCDPSIVILEHYFPMSFVLEKISSDKNSEFINQNTEVDKTIAETKYQISNIDDYKVTINYKDLENKRMLKFMKIHPQVIYIG